MNTIIAPSLLSANFIDLKSQLDVLTQFKDLWIHLDVMDGHFVPNLTFGSPLIEQLSNTLLPPLDVHLMVNNPEFHVEKLKGLKIFNITFHWETTSHHDRLLNEINKNFPSSGISLNPSTPVELIPEYIYSKIKIILVMSVNPGFGGQSFIESSIDKIKKLSEIRSRLKANFQIQVDGGVSTQNMKTLVAAGANNLVMGNALFKSPNKSLKENIKEVQGLLK